MTIVLLHGLGQTDANWEETIALLPKENAHLCPSLPELLAGKQATFQNLYTGLESYCDGISGTFCLCGLSLGGVLALQYAANHPQRLNSLILMGAQYRSPKLLLALQNLIFRFMKESSFQGLGFGKDDFIRLCITTGQVNLTAALSHILCPTLVLCGENDNLNKRAAQGLSRGIPGSRLVFIPQAGHELNKDCPEKLADSLQQFWESNLPK